MCVDRCEDGEGEEELCSGQCSSGWGSLILTSAVMAMRIRKTRFCIVAGWRRWL